MWAEGSVGLTSRRFALEDIAHGRQPATYGEVTVVWNGEIFNWSDLANQYGLDRRHGDTTLLPRLLARNGLEALAN
jgi:asparagine synthetase B (glutamine-hydrolysing)